MPIETVRGADAQALVPQVASVYREVFSVDPWRKSETVLAAFENEILSLHIGRENFALVVARDESDAIVGFCYGYTGRSGQFWTNFVADNLPGEVAAEWLDGHLEVAELAVLSSARGHGYGRAMLTELLTGRPEPRAVLQTLDQDIPALRLYQSFGFEPIGRAYGYVFLGLRFS